MNADFYEKCGINNQLQIGLIEKKTEFVSTSSTYSKV